MLSNLLRIFILDIMASINFDDVVSPLSHEDNLDRNWTEVPVAREHRATHGSFAPVISLVDKLQDLYWTGVKQEVAALILAFDEIQTLHPEETEEERQELAEAEGLLLDPEKDQIIKQWLKLWSKLYA